MPKSKSRKAKMASKHPATSPPPSDSKSSSKTTIKRIKIAKFVDPGTVGQERDGDGGNGVEDKDDDMPVIVDVSNIVYTLSQSCMIGEDPVLEDTKFLKLGEFSW